MTLLVNERLHRNRFLILPWWLQYVLKVSLFVLGQNEIICIDILVCFEFSMKHLTSSITWKLKVSWPCFASQTFQHFHSFSVEKYDLFQENVCWRFIENISISHRTPLYFPNNKTTRSKHIFNVCQILWTWRLADLWSLVQISVNFTYVRSRVACSNPFRVQTTSLTGWQVCTPAVRTLCA